MDTVYYTTDEVARICRVKVITVRTWLREGKLNGTRVNKAWLVAEEDLKKLLEGKHG